MKGDRKGENSKLGTVCLCFNPLATDKIYGQICTEYSTNVTTTHRNGWVSKAGWTLEPFGTDQHAPPPEAHHTQAALEREAVIVRGRDTRLKRLGTADAVGLLGFPLRIMHPLHMLPQFVFALSRENF